jgi:hypothetical protein
MSESRDQGLTWSPVVDSAIPNSGSGTDIVVLRDGRWVFIGNDLEDGRYRLVVMLSEDEGRSWARRRYLENDPPGPLAGRYHYPSIIQARDGSLHATYSHHLSTSRPLPKDAQRPTRAQFDQARPFQSRVDPGRRVGALIPPVPAEIFPAMNPPRAIIFDMDGVIVDSEPLHELAFREVFAEMGFDEARHGIDFKRYYGKSDRALWLDFIEMHSPPQPLEELLAWKQEHFLGILRKRQPIFPPIPDLVASLASRYPLAVASGSNHPVIDEVLSMEGLRRFFGIVVSVQDVARSKPFPGRFSPRRRVAQGGTGLLRGDRGFGGGREGGPRRRDAGHRDHQHPTGVGVVAGESPRPRLRRD